VSVVLNDKYKTDKYKKKVINKKKIPLFSTLPFLTNQNEMSQAASLFIRGLGNQSGVAEIQKHYILDRAGK
jgi:hypothetical protein